MSSSADPKHPSRPLAEEGDAHEARIGLLGGTFNPIHIGHLRAAEEVREALRLVRILFIPSAMPPHKVARDEDPIAPAAERLAWVESAIAGHSAFSVDRIEIDREGPSFLVDTLRSIRNAEGVAAGDTTPFRTVFIVGEDAFAEMGDWRSPEEIFELTDLAVMTRPPGRLERLEDRIPETVRDSYSFSACGQQARHNKSGTTIELVPISALDISSSAIRNRCREGRSIRYLVPESVRESIETSRRYAFDSPSVDRARGERKI